MSIDKRLDRLLPALSVQERAILILRNFKADKPQDRVLLNAAPDKQAPALNRLIGLMNAANGDLAHVITIIRERVRQEDLRFSWLEWARICALEMWAIGARFHLWRPRTDHRERVPQTRGGGTEGACSDRRVRDDPDRETRAVGRRRLRDR